MLTAWRHLQLSLMTRHKQTSYYYYYYYYFYNCCQFKSQWPSTDMSPSRRRRCRVELQPKDADVETLLNVVRRSQLPVGSRFLWRRERPARPRSLMSRSQQLLLLHDSWRTFSLSRSEESQVRNKRSSNFMKKVCPEMSFFWNGFPVSLT